MDVVNPCSALISNYEVYKILKETREEQKKIKNNFVKTNLRNLNTIAYETLKYFENISPCRFSNDATISDFVQAVKEFSLSKSELLQLVNLRPTTHVELHAIIEECEERYTEREIASLLELVGVHLHRNTRPRTSDSVCSYLSPAEEIDLASPDTTHFIHNSPLSHEEEVVDSSCLVEETAKPRKRKKKGSAVVPEEEEEEIGSKPTRKNKLRLSDEEEEGDGKAAILTCEKLPDVKLKSLVKESKVKLKIKNSTEKFKKKTRRTKPNRHVSISEDIDVVNIC